MSADRLDNGKFDEILERALQSHSEPVPVDFTEQILSRIKEVEQQRILAHIVWQERLALAGCIVLGAAVTVSAVLFPDTIIAVFKSITLSLIGQGQAFIDRIPRAIGIVRSDWQFYTVYVGIFAFVVYSLLDLLAANGERQHMRIYF